MLRDQLGSGPACVPDSCGKVFPLRIGDGAQPAKVDAGLFCKCLCRRGRYAIFVSGFQRWSEQVLLGISLLEQNTMYQHGEPAWRRKTFDRSVRLQQPLARKQITNAPR